jgi:hypothetical protein
MSQRAAGPFDVRLTQQPAEADSPIGRMTIDKHFHGDLEGSSQGQMLSVGTAVTGSAGYVAMERFTGTLQGRRGSFVLQHFATMTRGKPELRISVVPDSGEGELTGISGKMNIIIDGKKHSYEFDYELSKQD